MTAPARQVWIATWRKGITYHAPAAEAVELDGLTDCDRPMGHGILLSLAEARLELNASRCSGCYPEPAR